MLWLADDFVHPERVELPTGHHLRPIRATDVDIDYPAVMGSRDRLWSKYGDVWGWPPSDMTYAADRADLARHETEITAHESFNCAVLDEFDTVLLGCVYVDPPDKRNPSGVDAVVDAGVDAVVSWRVVDREVGGDLEQALGEFAPLWLAQRWGFHAAHSEP